MKHEPITSFFIWMENSMIHGQVYMIILSISHLFPRCLASSSLSILSTSTSNLLMALIKCLLSTDNNLHQPVKGLLKRDSFSFILSQIPDRLLLLSVS